MEPVGDSEPCDVTYGTVHHVAASGHDKPHVRGPLEHLGSSLDEIFRTFLESYSAKEGHHLVLDSPLDLQVVPAAEIHGIVHRHDLGRIDAVLAYDYVSGKVADGYDLVSSLHTVFLYRIAPGVDVVRAAAVERGGVHMHHERLPGHLLGGDAGIISKPVMGMDHVELILVLHGDRASHHCVSCHFLHQIGSILPGELELLTILDAEILDLMASLLFDHVMELLRIEVRYHVGPDMDELYLVEEVLDIHVFTHRYRDIAGIDDPGDGGIFVTCCRRHHENRIDPVVREAFHYSVAGSTETACDMWRELPAEHQHSHILVLPVFVHKIIYTQQGSGTQGR